MVNLKRGLPKELQSVISRLEPKQTVANISRLSCSLLEVAISDFAIEVLRGVKSYFVDDSDKEVCAYESRS